MEERKVKKTKKRKGDLKLRIASVVLAVVIWIILSITLFPNIQITVYDVPVKLDVSGTFAEENGLSVVNFNEDTKVDVKLSGMRYEIGNYEADDLVATVEIKDVYSDGTYDLGISVKSAHGDDCNFLKVTPSTCRVKFDYTKSLEFPVEVEYSGISADEGYTLKTPVVSPEAVKVTGPEGEISKISRAVVTVRENNLKLTEPYSVDDAQIMLYSESGKAIDTSNMTFSQETFNVTFSVNMSKTVPFTLNIKNVPDNFDLSTVKYTFEPENITVLSGKDISSLGSINVGSINLNEIDVDKEYEFDVVLDKDLTNASGIDKVKVRFDKNGFSSKKLTLDTSNIRILNAPADKTVEIKTEKISDVLIVGLESYIDRITANDVVAEFDMSSQNVENGNLQVQVKIYSPRYNCIWYSGEAKNVSLSISDKE